MGAGWAEPTNVEPLVASSTSQTRLLDTLISAKARACAFQLPHTQAHMHTQARASLRLSNLTIGLSMTGDKGHVVSHCGNKTRGKERKSLDDEHEEYHKCDNKEKIRFAVSIQVEILKLR